MGRTRRKKKHSHVAREPAPSTSVPRTFVMERGKVGSSLNQLILDLRRVMEPFTASHLKVRQRNVLKDFVQVAGPLGVTHFIVVSRTEEFINLRVCRLPRGPTLTFHVRAFSLARDVISSQRKRTVSTAQFLTPALLVLNNFSQEEKPSTLMATMFQNMFPSINIHSVKLSSVRRCVLFHYNPSSKTIEFRHYNIKVVPRGMSRGVKKLTRSQVPNLSRYQDISDYVLGGNASESEGEELVAESEVTLPQDVPGRGNMKAEQSAIRLSEIGPRLSLQLVKIESGLCEGEVLHHAFIHKSKHEAKELKHRVESVRRLREKRKRLQDSNVLQKAREREVHKQRSLAGQSSGRGLEDKQDPSDDDDMEWYRQEVGEEPDPDTFVSGAGPKKRKGRMGAKYSPKAKRRKPDSKQTTTPLQSKTKHKFEPPERQKGGSDELGEGKPLVQFVGKRQRQTELPRKVAGTKGKSAGRRVPPPPRKVAAGRVFRRRVKATSNR